MSIDFTGRWKADLSQSRLLGPPPKAMTMAIVHSEPDLRQEIAVTKEDGSEQRITFRCQTTGEPDQCRFNEEAVRGTAQWQGEELVVELWIQQVGREFYLCDRWSLSPHGQTLTMEHRNDALSGQVAVLRRTSD
jgi:hypothetical protein